MHIAVLGSGYVGLVSGACLADFGHRVTCVDLDAGKIAQLRAGRIPIFEPGLEQLVASNAASGRLSFSTAIEDAVAAADVVFIAVGTPSRPQDGSADLSYVYRAAETIGTAMRGFTVVVTKSTVPVGTGDEVEQIIARSSRGGDFAVVSNPEFLREGMAIHDFMQPDRIVIGTEDARARAVMAAIYQPLGGSVPILNVTRRTSELIKYASNAFLAMKITFINEVADLCEALGAEVPDVARGIGLDQRIGPKFLNAGPGYGGSCFPKDTLALVKAARDHGVPVSLIDTTVEANAARKQAMARKVVTACGGSVKNKKVAVLGLTFKPDTDDMRESPSLAIIDALQKQGASITAYDPEGMATAARLLSNVEYGLDAYSIADGADALVIVTEWSEFRALDFPRLGAMMKSRILVDLRNIYDADQLAEHGFLYTSIGRQDRVQAGQIMQAAE
ncbi:UDP-glucose/GDP-mannose dehydrogenase family protein [Mesorhizobium sp. CAU 1741]|uniref:UDP-glucose dehydrogenase family protein n=1 Tax=Mesorhizobium sp. CAU 1741 TaxID=3140366 RepID=UPI00325A5CC9